MIVKNEKQLLANASTPELRKARKILIELVNHVIGSVNPRFALRRNFRIDRNSLKIGSREFDLSEIERIWVVGGGKASGAMAEELEQMLGERIDGGIVNVPKGTASKHRTKRIKFIEAGHPIPTEEGVKGAEQIMEAVRNLGPRDLVICLISGGGSALLPLPAEGITLEEFQETTRFLLKSGATIQEVNTVRKHLSRIKGGQLAKAAYPARIVSLLISDVVGDRLDTIASGPTAPDPTTFSDALAVLKKYELLKEISRGVINRLKDGACGKIPETPKPGDKCFQNVTNEIILSNKDAIEAASQIGKKHGLNILIFENPMQGEAREMGTKLASTIGKMVEQGKQRPALLVAGGETTVTVKGEGLGGRNQEIVLSAAMKILNLKVAITSFSTDGIDGPTDAAGAVADGLTLERSGRLNLDPSSYLARNDSYRFFEQIGDLLITGPTGTNVMDVFAAIIL